MNFVSDHDWHDHIELIEGEPDPPTTNSVRISTDCIGEPTKEIMALCLLCYASHPIGKYIYENHPIELEDGTTTTFEDWRAEAGRNRVRKSRRRRMYCPRCDFLTDHVAEV